MAVAKDVFFRSHVVELKEKQRFISTYSEPAWTEYLLLYDTETRVDAEQSLTFGFYRVCRLNGENKYECVEEGIVHAENLNVSELQIIQDYVRSHRSEVINDVFDERLHVYSRTDFVEKVFWEAVRNKSLICAFNAPFDISRLSVGYKPSRNRGFTLVLSERTSRKTGELEPNPDRPCVRVTSKDSKAAFFSLTKPVKPEEWPCYEIMRQGDEKPQFCHCGESATHRTADNVFLCAKHAKVIKETGQKVTPIKKLRLIFRVLDLRTLGWALFNESRGLIYSKQ